MRWLVGISCVAVALGAGVAGAQNEDVMPLDREGFGNVDVELGVVKRLDGREAIFSLDHSRNGSSDDTLSGSITSSMVPMPVASRRRPARLRIEPVRCEAPLAVLGTVDRRVARVEVVNRDGLVTRLTRRRPPAGWGSRARVIGKLYPHRAAVREVRARLRGGRIVARVRPRAPEPCPQP